MLPTSKTDHVDKPILATFHLHDRLLSNASTTLRMVQFMARSTKVQFLLCCVCTAFIVVDHRVVSFSLNCHVQPEPQQVRMSGRRRTTRLRPTISGTTSSAVYGLEASRTALEETEFEIDPATIETDSEQGESPLELETLLLSDPRITTSRSAGQDQAVLLLQAALIGTATGAAVGLFKLSIEQVRQFSYNLETAFQFLPLIPAAGGVLVTLLQIPGAFPPGLRGTVQQVAHQEAFEPLAALRKSIASVMTLGTGNSLGPEGPSVEIGMAVSRACCIPKNAGNDDEIQGGYSTMHYRQQRQRDRLLLSSGAAAGVSAGFNAPIAAVFFALEIVQGAFDAVDEEESADGQPQSQRVPVLSNNNISAVLIASVLAALIARAVLGDELALHVTQYQLRTPLLELPLYLLLGAICGAVAAIFSAAAKTAQSIFDGKCAFSPLRIAMQAVPEPIKPIMGGLICGLIGVAFPQTLFFGYETLNSLLAKTALPTDVLLQLLFAKTISTALAAASGLVGGTFAPALFLGAMTGGAFHNLMVDFFNLVLPADAAALAEVPAYAMVGAASVLAALFRAPLTSSLLLFELTRDYDVILPLMASAGLGSLVGDWIEEKVEQLSRREEWRDRDAVSWGDLAD